MTDGETELLCRELDQASSYFEYGAGESTKHAARRPNIKRMVSVESDNDFIEKNVISDSPVADAVERGRLSFASIDIGPTGRWGRPVDTSEKQKWPNYPAAIERGGGNDWDLVLVDGLFRVACVATALTVSPNAKIFVHDFWRRKRYRPVLRFCDVVETADQLVSLSRKPDVSDSDLQAMLHRHQFLPADKTVWLSFQSKLGFKV